MFGKLVSRRSRSSKKMKTKNKPNQPPTAIMSILKCDLFIFVHSFKSLKWHICLFSLKRIVCVLRMCLHNWKLAEHLICFSVMYVHCQTNIAFEQNNSISNLCSEDIDFLFFPIWFVQAQLLQFGIDVFVKI